MPSSGQCARGLQKGLLMCLLDWESFNSIASMELGTVWNCLVQNYSYSVPAVLLFVIN